ncbi:hypothetical protein [Pseudidiomarina woesei]|uniref:DUF262 domain-containing protein n=1 Tax=Pseudidiomarina woesei TaxID=1381080 RepID=A0A0K6HA66_9GAMM|nr:hypothetical protein [Pseudidiomarina woesei]CUA87869.1 hypothetical protein Ga0061064_1969 [Pseudidiomarina woesei]
MSALHVLEDTNKNSFSIMFTMNIDDYLALVDQAYKDSGGVEGQRAPLKTKTGQRIRKRMVLDIIEGAVLPPLVLGATLTPDQVGLARKIDSDADGIDLLHQLEDISIIDGMQRTTALKEALKLAQDEFTDKVTDIRTRKIRVELWVAESVNSLIYRMLVLNTGQVPWDMKRQLQTIYKSILKEIRASVDDINVLGLEQGQRRTQGGQFQGDKLIEFFLSFTSRKTAIDLKEKVAEDFARMDATEATSSSRFLRDFIICVQLLVNLDHAFSRANNTKEELSDSRIKSGKDVFKSFPAGLGFFAAAATKIYGKPGYHLDDDITKRNLEVIVDNVDGLVTRLTQMSPEDVRDFLDLDTLNEKLSRKTSKVGAFEREFFQTAFSELITEGNHLPNMSPCWEAYY